MIQLLCLFASLFSTSPECPDIGLKHVRGTVEYGRDLPCQGFSASAAGISVSTSAQCPSFVLVTPAHDVPVHQPGCGTYVKPNDTFIDVTKQTYECKTSRFLFFPIGVSCNLKRDAVVAKIPGYSLYACQ
ncbi:MAG: hypothetical protein KDB80_01330 [Planctomycetes bacterium]|nr:hypothetical protein [Planctomycetota bacterium]